MFNPGRINDRHYTDGYTDGWRGNAYEPPLTPGGADQYERAAYQYKRAAYTKGFTDSRRDNARRVARFNPHLIT